MRMQRLQKAMHESPIIFRHSTAMAYYYWIMLLFFVGDGVKPNKIFFSFSPFFCSELCYLSALSALLFLQALPLFSLTPFSYHHLPSSSHPYLIFIKSNVAESRSWKLSHVNINILYISEKRCVFSCKKKHCSGDEGIRYRRGTLV